MSLRFSPESKQPDRALREWASSDMRRNHDARLRAAKSEYGHLFSVGRANAARSPAPATPAAHGAAETRRPRPSSASPSAPTTPGIPAAGGFASARNHPGSDGGAKLRAAAQTALLSPKNQARWSPPPRGASRRSASPLADAASLGGSRLARGSATRVPSPPAAAYYATGAETPAPASGSASASSSNHGSGSGRPSTGRSVARFLRRRQELRRCRAEEEADAATHHSPSDKKAAEEDKENVDPMWAEFDASPPSATHASLDEVAGSSSRVRGGTHETPPRGTEEEEPPRAESTTGTREESADAARRGSARSPPPSPVSRALASLPSLKTAREAPSRFAAPGFDSASPPGHRLGAKGAAHAVFAAALADAEGALEAIDATRYPAAAPPAPDVAGAATTPTPGEDSPSPSSAEPPQSRRGNPTFADTPSPLRPFNATAANAGSTGGTAGSSSSAGPFDERFSRASAFSGSGGGFSERAFAGATPGRASSIGDARGAADRYSDADGARYGGLDDEDSAWDEYEDGVGRRGSEDPSDGSARDATGSEGWNDDDVEAAAEAASPFRMMVAPRALKRAAAAHARSLSLVEAANKAHEDAGGVVEYRRYG